MIKNQKLKSNRGRKPSKKKDQNFNKPKVSSMRGKNKKEGEGKRNNRRSIRNPSTLQLMNPKSL
jgi:hypothetical protein